MTDLFKTRDQLIERALKSIGALQPGEAPSAEDYDTVDDLIDPLLAQLAQDEIVNIQDPDQIDLAVYLPLARLLANAAGPDFGSPINEDAKMRDENTLRRLAAAEATGEVLKAVYY